jgi:mono/diheme cytochrome c family protein
MEDRLRLLCLCLVFSVIGVAPAALAADADNGQRIAEARCVTCHRVGPVQRREVADAPPFDAIARKFAVSPELLAFEMLEPHPRMNVRLTRREAQDIAAYINTLAK